MKKSVIFLISLLALCGPLTLFSQDLATLTIQGVVRDDKGGAVTDGDYNFTFKIYDVETGGTELWTENHDGSSQNGKIIKKIPVKNGVYTAILGSGVSFSSANLGFDKPYYVGVSFNNKPEMSPRIRLTAAPYALALQGGSNVFPSSGKVGIGTNAPSAKLSVSDNGTTLNIKPQTNNEVLLDIPNSGTIKIWDDLYVIGGMTTRHPSQNTRLKIDRPSSSLESNLQFQTGGAGQFNIGLDNDSENLTIYSYGGPGMVMTIDNQSGQVSVNDGLEVSKGLTVSGNVEMISEPKFISRTSFVDDGTRDRYYSETATTDGIVTAWCADGSDWVQAFGYVKISGAYKLVAKCESRTHDSAFIMMPVQKDHRWKVTFTAQSGRVDEYDVVWTPIGK